MAFRLLEEGVGGSIDCPQRYNRIITNAPGRRIYVRIYV